MLLQLQPPIPLLTTKGEAEAVILIDYGPEYDLCWVCFLRASRECWTFTNKDIRAPENVTFGRDYIPHTRLFPQG